jgi:hypothetical protein
VTDARRGGLRRLCGQDVQRIGELAQPRLLQDRFVAWRDAAQVDEDAREALGVRDRVFELRPIAPAGIGPDHQDVALERLGAPRSGRHQRRQYTSDHQDRNRFHRRLSF